MDPLIQRLQIAQTLIQQLLVLIPPSSHAQAQVALNTATLQLKAIMEIPPASPLVAPQLVPESV